MRGGRAGTALRGILTLLLVSAAMVGCASMRGPSGQMADSLHYVRQHRGEGLRRTVAGSEAELMATVVKNMEKGETYRDIVREPHAILAKASNVDLTYAFYFYPSATHGRTEVEVLLASPWLDAGKLRKYQEEAFSTILVDINRKVLEEGFDPNVKAPGGLFPLSTAVFDSQRETAKKLIDRGANPDLALDELKEIAARQVPYLSHPANRKSYDKANAGILMLKELMIAQKSPRIPVAAGTGAPTSKKPLARSDIDELPVTRTRPRGNSYAILIGIENYRQKLPAADFAAQDAQLVAEYLIKVMGYPEENVVTLLNDHAALGDFVKYFERWLPNNVESGGTVFVYYSGHGAPNPRTADAYLVPYDGDPSFIHETGYSLKRMYAALGKLPAQKIVVALDSCFSGAGGRSVLAKGARPLVMNLARDIALPDNVVVMSASSGNQMSSTYDEKGHGLFTYFMLKGIKSEAVVRPDGSLNIDELYAYLKPRVERIARKQYNNEQSPQLIEPKKH